MKNKMNDKELLNFLEKQTGYTSAAKIAAAFDVSVKTVYRHVNSVNGNKKLKSSTPKKARATH